jgi:hypothetical protein
MYVKTIIMCFNIKKYYYLHEHGPVRNGIGSLGK